MTPELPPATELTRAQYSGWACVYCRAPLDKGAVFAGRAQGSSGAHDLSVEVYACPSCADAPTIRNRTGQN